MKHEDKVKREENKGNVKRGKRYENLVEVVEEKKRNQKRRRKEGDLRYIYERRYLTHEEWEEVKFVHDYVYKKGSDRKGEIKTKYVGNNPETPE